MVSQTSIESYRTLKDLGQDQRVAYSQIEIMSKRATKKSELPSRRDVAYELGWETSKVAARVNDLIHFGFVVEVSKKADSRTGKFVNTLSVANPFADRSY